MEELAERRERIATAVFAAAIAQVDLAFQPRSPNVARLAAGSVEAANILIEQLEKAKALDPKER